MRARRPFVRHDREPPPAYVAVVGAESRPALRSAVRRHDTVGHHIWQSPEQDIRSFVRSFGGRTPPHRLRAIVIPEKPLQHDPGTGRLRTGQQFP